MILFPAIDLVAGKVVRLSRGDRSKMDVYADDPVAVARDFAARGARWIHVVDLSATFGEGEEALCANHRAIEGICRLEGVSVDVGGGVRSIESIERLVEVGVGRIALGTVLVRDPELARRAVARFGELLVADVAARDGRVRVNGWREGADILAERLVGDLATMGFRHLVFTDIARDGMQTGIDADAYVRMARLAGFPIIASGGIAGLEDIRTLAELGPRLVEGAICGRALFEGNFTLEEALAAAGEGCASGRERGQREGESHAD